MSFLKEKYKKDVARQFKEEFGARNVMAVPRITKVTLNCGIGKYLKEKEAVDEIAAALRDISGQKPVFAKAKKSISGFKLRQGQDVAITVTLRGQRMWHFLERLVHTALPRIRDFQGIDPKNLDANGNLNLAVKEHIVFPEIAAENVRNIFGFQVTVTNTAKTREEGTAFFRMLGFPLRTEK